MVMSFLFFVLNIELYKRSLSMIRERILIFELLTFYLPFPERTPGVYKICYERQYPGSELSEKASLDNPSSMILVNIGEYTLHTNLFTA